VIRLAVVAGALLLWFWTQRLLGRRPAPAGAVGDRVHEWTAGLHARLLANPGAADGTLVASSLLIDAVGLSLVGAALLGPTFRPFLALLVVFSLRQACQALCSLPAPPGMIWRDPGFPTLLVTYKVGNDFFFSGHTAIAVLGALEAARAGPAWLAVAAGAVAVLEASAVLVLRAHWTMDVLAGILAAFLGDGLAARAAPRVDAWLGS
jgi:membrane-associated phospholipid phosphatase